MSAVPSLHSYKSCTVYIQYLQKLHCILYLLTEVALYTLFTCRSCTVYSVYLWKMNCILCLPKEVALYTLVTSRSCTVYSGYLRKLHCVRRLLTVEPFKHSHNPAHALLAITAVQSMVTLQGSPIFLAMHCLRLLDATYPKTIVIHTVHWVFIF